MPSTFHSQTFSSTTSTLNGATTSRTQSTQSDNTGTRVHQTSQAPGQPLREERFEVDSAGRRVQAGADAGRITDVSDEQQQQERDREYEERIGDEYAKREEGA